MGQKIHPTGFRLPVTRAGASRWFANKRNFCNMLAEDLHVRDFLKARLVDWQDLAHQRQGQGKRLIAEQDQQHRQDSQRRDH